MSRSYDIVAVKSFGDLIIALNAVAAADAARTGETRILLGEHLLPLYHASGSSVPIAVLEHGEGGVPSLYDVRKNGWRRAVITGWHLRRSIGKAARQTLLFDRIGWREKLIAGGHEADALPVAENIYLSYQAMFPAAERRQDALPTGGRRIGIFPGSRLASKNLPVELVRATEAAIRAAGLEPALLLLEGERPDLELAYPEATIVPRSFEAMIDAVRGCDAVVSADSMPAHVAELVGRRVFVFSPVDNRYWLPLSAFSGHWWSLFADGPATRLQAFFSAISGDAR